MEPSLPYRQPQSGSTWLGIVLLALWIPLVGFGFWREFLRDGQPLGDDLPTRQLSRRLEDWYRLLPQAAAGGPASTVLYLGSPSCSCPTADREEVEQLRNRLADYRARFLEIKPADSSAASDAQAFEVLVFSSGGHLLYGGPLHSTAFCGGTHTLVELTLAAASDASRLAIPLLLPMPCRCGRDSHLS